MKNDRLIRWEEKRREYLGSAITIMLGLSSASLAFCGALLTQKEVVLGGWRTFWFIAAVIFLILALIASISVHFTRLQDARETANIVRTEGEPMAVRYIELMRNKAEFWGKMTWFLLYAQLVTFSLGACFLLISLWLILYSKLFPS